MGKFLHASVVFLQIDNRDLVIFQSISVIYCITVSHFLQITRALIFNLHLIVSYNLFKLNGIYFVLLTYRLSEFVGVFVK